MTRINVVPVEELCDQHLLAEHRELTRIPNCLYSGKYQYHYADRPSKYVLGSGHVKFFTNKLGWLLERYSQLGEECKKRGFNVSHHQWEQQMRERGFNFEMWKPDEDAMKINRERIAVRMPVNARYYGRYITS